MLAGSINYQLSLGYILTFLLAGMGVVSILHTYRNLAHLAVSAGRVEPVFAGDTLRFHLHFDNPTTFDRVSIEARCDAARAACDVPAHGAATVVLMLPAAAARLVPRAARDRRDALPGRAAARVELRATGRRGARLSAARGVGPAAPGRGARPRRRCHGRYRATTTSAGCAPTSRAIRRGISPGRRGARGDAAHEGVHRARPRRSSGSTGMRCPPRARRRGGGSRSSPTRCSPPKTPTSRTGCACPGASWSPRSARATATPACKALALFDGGRA